MSRLMKYSSVSLEAGAAAEKNRLHLSSPRAALTFLKTTVLATRYCAVSAADGGASASKLMLYSRPVFFAQAPIGFWKNKDLSNAMQNTSIFLPICRFCRFLFFSLKLSEVKMCK